MMLRLGNYSRSEAPVMHFPGVRFEATIDSPLRLPADLRPRAALFPPRHFLSYVCLLGDLRHADKSNTTITDVALAFLPNGEHLISGD